MNNLFLRITTKMIAVPSSWNFSLPGFSETVILFVLFIFMMIILKNHTMSPLPHLFFILLNRVIVHTPNMKPITDVPREK